MYAEVRRKVHALDSVVLDEPLAVIFPEFPLCFMFSIYKRNVKLQRTVELGYGFS